MRALAATEHEAAVNVLVGAFRTYPTTRWLVAPSHGPEDAALAALIGFFVTARRLRGEPVFGAFTGGRLAGVALVSDSERASSDALDGYREALWAELGAAARARYEAYGAAASAATAVVAGPRLHLNLLGTSPACRGLGLGNALVRHVLERADAQRRTVTTTTEDAANVGFYERHGFTVLGTAALGTDLTVWGLARSLG